VDVRLSLRARNLCWDCKTDFHVPFGQDLALRCPACGSFATEARAPSLLAPVVFVAVAATVMAILWPLVGPSGSRTEREGWFLHFIFEVARHLGH
jgi:hypothetical protein